MLKMDKNLLSNRVKNMPESATLKMAQMARDLKAQGIDIVDMSLGEPDFDTPQDIKDAAKKALDEGFTKYTPVPGLPLLRQAIVDKLKRDNNLDYNIDQIVVTNGAKQAIANICLAMLNPGDEVVLFTPYWVSYDSIIKIADGVPVTVSAGIDQDFKISAQQLETAITDKTRLVLFSSPSNPTGSVYSHEELLQLAEVLRKHPDIYIISDEIYEYINFGAGHASIASFDFLKDRVIIVNGMSKGFAMTGWRIGYMAADADVAKSCIKIQGQFTSGANSFGQVAAAYALNHGIYKEMVEKFAGRRKVFIKLLKEIPGFKVNEPMGAFYLFPDISYYFGKSKGKITINNSLDFSEHLLKDAHVATVAGTPFGAPECIRFSYATSMENIEEAARRIKEFVEGFE